MIRAVGAESRILSHHKMRRLPARKVFLAGSSGITKCCGQFVPITPPEAVIPETLIVDFYPPNTGKTASSATGGMALQQLQVVSLN